MQHNFEKCQAVYDSCKGSDIEKCLYLAHNFKAFRLALQDVLDFFTATHDAKPLGMLYIVKAEPEDLILQPFFPGKFDNMEGFYLPRRVRHASN